MDFFTKYSGILLAILSIAFPQIVICIEENRQEIYLEPRNFNPHPYEIDGNIPQESLDSRRNGPILFPASPAPEPEGRSNFVSLRNSNGRNLGHPVDQHPYSKVADKYRYVNPARYDDYENEINPRISQALSNHARKVLTGPAASLNENLNDDYSSYEKKNYAFSYKVVDHLTGDDFSHRQTQDAQATNGEYRVKLPDGRVQIVSYTADKNGYKADVKYTDDNIKETAQKVHLKQAVDYTGNQIESYPNVQYRQPIQVEHPEQQQAYVDQRKQVLYEPERYVAYSPVPTQPTVLSQAPFIIAVTDATNYNNYVTPQSNQQKAGPVVFPRNYLSRNQQLPQQPIRIISNDKVEIVNQGHPGGSSSPYLENPAVIISSTAAPYLNDYGQVYITTGSGQYGQKK